MRINRYFLALFFLISCVISAQADVIIMKDGDEKEGTVVKISSDELTYVVQGSEVQRVLPLSKVLLVKYDNGEKEVFNTAKDAYNANQSATSKDFFPIEFPIEIPTDYSSLPPASKVYKVGDLYDEHGVRGMVVDVTPDGRHGKIIALYTKGSYYSFVSYINSLSNDVPLGCTSFTDGLENTTIIRSRLSAIRDQNGSRQPLLEWLDEAGPGWYLPSYGEMIKLLYTLADQHDKSKLKNFNKLLKSYGGKPINVYIDHTTSTEQKVPKQNRYCFGLVKFDDFWGYTESMYYNAFGRRDGEGYRFFHLF